VDEVTLSLAPMSEAWAREVAAWRYEAPYDRYDGEEGGVAGLLDGNHVAVLDDGEFVGYVGTGPECRVPGGPDAGGCTDVGIGIRPDRLSERLGTRIGELAMQMLATGGHDALRVSVLSSNERSLRLALRLGFHETGMFTSTVDGSTFTVLERELLA
jgi:ribosomal-protein-alanine N-acetyltransferase